jgi:hypothetical protein
VRYRRRIATIVDKRLEIAVIYVLFFISLATRWARAKVRTGGSVQPIVCLGRVGSLLHLGLKGVQALIMRGGVQ